MAKVQPAKGKHAYEQPMHRPRMELFAQKLATGMNLTDAYVAAGYTGKHAPSRATTLYRRSKALQARVAFLMSQHADAAAVTVTELTSMFRAVFKGAMGVKQYSAANGAAFNLGKLHGLIVDKAQVEVIRRPTRDPDAPTELAIEGWIETLEGGEDVVQTDAGRAALHNGPDPVIAGPANRTQGPDRALDGNGGSN